MPRPAMSRLRPARHIVSRLATTLMVLALFAMAEALALLIAHAGPAVPALVMSALAMIAAAGAAVAVGTALGAAHHRRRRTPHIQDTDATHRAPDATGTLTLTAYEAGARTTARYPTDGLTGLYYATMGLAGEAGEIANRVKKLIRDHGEHLPEDVRMALVAELGDVLWYCAALSWEVGVPLEQVAAANLAKLRDRAERGVLGGSGDHR